MEHYIEHDGCRIFHAVDGPSDAPALLLVNSLGADMRLWDAQMPAWSAAFRVIRYDQRGHGRSSVPEGDYTLDQLGRDALAVLDATGTPSAHVCGVSLGGITALWLGVYAPDRIRGLVAANTAARIGTEQSWNDRIALVKTKGMRGVADQAIPRWFTEEFRRRHPDTIQRIRAMVEACSPAGYLGCCAALRDADLRDAIQAIRAPVLAIAAPADELTPPSAAEYIRDQIPGARLVMLEASHLSNVEKPEEFAAVVTDFLREME